MTNGAEVLKLPICPECKDTRHCQKMPYLTVSSYHVCTACNLEWSSSGIVKNLGSGEYVQDNYFPKRKTRGFLWGQSE